MEEKDNSFERWKREKIVGREQPKGISSWRGFLEENWFICGIPNS